MRTVLLLLLPTALAACGGGPNPVKDAFAQATRDDAGQNAVLFRLAAQRAADARVYRLPNLDAQDGTVEAGGGIAAAFVGFVNDAGTFYVLDTEQRLIAVDPASNRARIADTAVALATVGPTGTVVAVHEDGAVGLVEFRGTAHWGSGFSARPERIWGGLRDRVIGVVGAGADRRLEMVAEGRPRTVQDLPAGDVAVAPWGDAAAVATTDGIILLDPANPDARRAVSLPAETRQVAFSASGHRLLVLGADGVMRILERFSLDELGGIVLPNPGHALRRDVRGERVFVQGDRDTTWVVDVLASELAASLPGAWDDLFPMAAPDGTVLVRRGGRVVAHDANTLAPADSVPDSPGDLWLLATWDQRELTPELELQEAPGTPAAGSLLYVQVSSTSNEAWANDLAASLAQAGIAASVLPPTEQDKRFRVVVGPYATRDEAEALRRRLHLPSWIFELDTATITP